MEVTAGRDHDSTGSGDSGRGASEEGERRGRPRPGEAPPPIRTSGRCIAGFIPKCSSNILKFKMSTYSGMLLNQGLILILECSWMFLKTLFLCYNYFHPSSGHPN